MVWRRWTRVEESTIDAKREDSVVTRILESGVRVRFGLGNDDHDDMKDDNNNK